MPDRRRHGAHEDRGARRARRQIRALAARPPGRLSAALRALCGTRVVAHEPARSVAGGGAAIGGDCWLQRTTQLAALAFGLVPRRRFDPPPPLAGEGWGGGSCRKL